MNHLQFSLRALLFVLIPVVAVAALAIRERKPRLVHTGNPFDVAIAGRGYFCVTGEFSENPRFARSGHLLISANGQLCLRVDGETVWLSPMITIPTDYQEFFVREDGRVEVRSGGPELLQQGQLELSQFAAANLSVFDQPLFEANDETGAPAPTLPGEHGSGLIKQGYREQRGLIWQRESMMTLLVGFALGVLATAMLIYRRKKPTTSQP